ncbi:hypothetical protein AKJ09_11236 [Labilithrix luteola]|uniref:Uncharacterized protein n=1 Tax=Labilithrix luteola TaxID=1391654 RepID=A0A0K1QFS2_9BACT|nr:hypothetical protein AKJ09_11236 [Labilithrix luteola]
MTGTCENTGDLVINLLEEVSITLQGVERLDVWDEGEATHPGLGMVMMAQRKLMAAMAAHEHAIGARPFVDIANDLHMLTVALGNDDAPPERAFLQDAIHRIALRAEIMNVGVPANDVQRVDESRKASI